MSSQTPSAAPNNIDQLIGGKFKILKSIGKGSFGEVYCGVDVYTNSEVAIKIESNKSRFSLLSFEAKVYRYLADGFNIPAAKFYHLEGHRKALVMELLGPSLEDLLGFCKRRFSVKTVLMLADQMISMIEFLHKRFIIHRDIKPDNFVMGVRKNSNKVYIIDFGLAKQYCISNTFPHIVYTNRKYLIGTARYASINAHVGIEQSRRDDLESLGYCFIYFLLGELPWQGLRGTSKKNKNERILERKLCTPVDTLCGGIPNEFSLYLKYCRNLRFDQTPDYNFLRVLFRDLYTNLKLPLDSKFDWCSLNIDSINSSHLPRNTNDTVPVTSTPLHPGLLPTNANNKKNDDSLACVFYRNSNGRVNLLRNP